MSEARRRRSQELILDQQLSTLQAEQTQIKAGLDGKLDASALPSKDATDADKFLAVAGDGEFELVSAADGPTGPQGPAGPQGPEGPSGTTTVSDGAITTAKLADDAVTTAKLANGSVRNDNIGGYTIEYNKLAGNIQDWQINETFREKLLLNGGAQEPLKPWDGQTISGAQFGKPKKPLNTFYNCRFLGRSTELHCTLNGSAMSENSKRAMFNQVWSAVTMAQAGDPDPVLNINFTTNGLTGSNGFTYSQGWVLISFYSAWTPTAMTARTKDRNGNWLARTVRQEHSQSTQNQTYLNSWSIQLGGNYVTDIEITMTPQASGGNRCAVSNISYFGTRMDLPQGPLVTCAGGKYFGKMSGVQAGVEQWSIQQDGTADFDGDIRYQGRPVLPVNQFFDATNGYVYTVYGVNHNWRVTRSGSAGMAQATGTSGSPPNSLPTLQGLTYS